MKRWIGGALLGGLLLLTTPVGAQDAEAEALFRAGVDLAKAGKYDDAVVKLRASYKLDPAPGTLLGLAAAEEAAGRIADALGHYQTLSLLAGKRHDRDKAKYAKQRITALEPKVGHVTLRVKGLPDRAEVAIDERWLPIGALGTALPVDPGEHAFKVVLDGQVLVRKMATASSGERQEVVLVVPPSAPRKASVEEDSETAPPPPATFWTPLKIGGVSAAGAGVVAAGVGAFFLARAADAHSELEAGCVDGRCPPALADTLDRGPTEQTIGGVLMAVGGVAVLTGLGLFVWDLSRQEPGPLSLQVGPGRLALRGRF